VGGTLLQAVPVDVPLFDTARRRIHGRHRDYLDVPVFVVNSEQETVGFGPTRRATSAARPGAERRHPFEEAFLLPSHDRDPTVAVLEGAVQYVSRASDSQAGEAPPS
jgi:hypothetical protein